MATTSKLSRLQNALNDFSCFPCTNDGKNTEGVFQCINCQLFYCRICAVGHNKYMKSHNVIDKTSKLFGRCQTKQGANFSDELPTDLCDEHLGEVVKMFCSQHDLVCCPVCITSKHRDKSNRYCRVVEYVPKIANIHLKQSIKNETEASLEKVQEELQNIKSKTQDEMNELNKQRGEILKQIHEFKKSLIERVEELADASIKEVQDKHKEIADSLIDCGKKINAMLEDVGKQLDKLKQSDINNKAQIFVDVKYGKMKVSDGYDCIKQSAGRKAEIIEFEVNQNIETRIHEIHSLGTLKVSMIVRAMTEQDDMGKEVKMDETNKEETNVSEPDNRTSQFSAEVAQRPQHPYVRDQQQLPQYPRLQYTHVINESIPIPPQGGANYKFGNGGDQRMDR